jgi:SAM-dependent methyltransferase
MTMYAAHPAPKVVGLDAALGGVRGTLATVERYRTQPGTNTQGGDPAHHASPDLLLRHTVNYLLAADIAATVPVPGPLLDVGSGVAVFSAWLARRLERALCVVDHDPRVLQLARRSFADLTTHDDLAEAPPAPVVTAMEVLEHVRYADQAAFVRALFDRVVPGGVLICSTPDECGYLGGWSGYAPHVGTLDAGSLRTLLRTATGAPVDVWRIDGPAFRLRTAQRLGEPIVNRVWSALQATLPGLTNRVVGTVGRRRRVRVDVFDPGPPDDAYTVTAADECDAGTGMLAVVRRPERQHPTV